ncbi:kinesin-domain-containing protein [Auriculariales sp. MPI-PUGE-AT-0066]|nr:kinesin-domain-containing protein [Auriculariales sp. MPI-PUGE-AT-0066]
MTVDDSASIAIAVRVRPPTAWEGDRLPDVNAFENAFRGDGNLAAAPRRGLTGATLKESVTVMDDKVLNRRFIFDRVFDASAHQVDVFEATALPLLNGILDGFNATVFAYGATGCGKTHTISGTVEDPGIIYQTMAELFQRIDDRKDEILFDISVTFLEIYNEEIHDLLADDGAYRPKGGLAIREDQTVKIVGLTELTPKNAEEVKAIVAAGNSRRTQSPTHANETSSRSHAVLQVHVAQSPRTANTTESRTMATLSIIDLAGSERASATKNMGQRMVEGANINKSLLALGNCINALCESGTRSRHIPYRNSKLTRLLKFSLGGNCKTVMIVCVAPTSLHFEDTLNTLQYADRAKMIRTKVSRNIINVDRHVAQYVEAINRLNEEVRELKAKLAGQLGNESEISKRKAAQAKAEVQRMKADMQTKSDQVRGVIAAAGTSQGELNVAQAQINATKLRLANIDAVGPEAALPSDLLTERRLLDSVISTYSGLTAPNSHLHQTIGRAENANSMFDAMLRAVTERKVERLDDLSIDNIRLQAASHRAELQEVKAEAERDALRKVVKQQSEVMTSLVGMIARCTVMMNDGSSTLASSSPNDTVTSVADGLKRVAQSNDQTFSASSLTSFTSHAVATTSKAAPARVKIRHPSLGLGSPARRRVSVGRAHALPKKSLRWADESAEGKLTEGNTTVLTSAAAGSEVSSSTNATMDSEWEDEKTDDRAGPKTRPGRGAGKVDAGLPNAKVAQLRSVVEQDEDSDFPLIPRKVPFRDRSNQLPSASEHAKRLSGVTSKFGFDERTSSDQEDHRASRGGHRRSYIGVLRSEKGRRKSSLLPVPSPPSTASTVPQSAPRRVIASTAKSPAKRAKRLSFISRHSIPLMKPLIADISVDAGARQAASRKWR